MFPFVAWLRYIQVLEGPHEDDALRNRQLGEIILESVSRKLSFLKKIRASLDVDIDGQVTLKAREDRRLHLGATTSMPSCIGIFIYERM